jgi:IS5 family transposase
VEGTAAHVSDISQAHALLHGEEKRAGADAGYTGVEKRPEIVALGRAIEWRVAARRSTLKAQPQGWAKAIHAAWETLKARARALVEHPFHIIKNIFKHRKVRYRGLEKNTGQLRVLFALANLYLVRRQLTGSAEA